MFSRLPEPATDFSVLFQLLNKLRVDEQRRFWIASPEAKDDA